MMNWAIEKSRTTDDMNDFELELNSYSFTRSDSDSTHTEGDLIHVKKYTKKFSSHKLFILEKNYWYKVITATKGVIQ